MLLIRLKTEVKIITIYIIYRVSNKSSVLVMNEKNQYQKTMRYLQRRNYKINREATAKRPLFQRVPNRDVHTKIVMLGTDEMPPPPHLNITLWEPLHAMVMHMLNLIINSMVMNKLNYMHCYTLYIILKLPPQRLLLSSVQLFLFVYSRH